jgi:hypothetical protein
MKTTGAPVLPLWAGGLPLSPGLKRVSGFGLGFVTTERVARNRQESHRSSKPRQWDNSPN